MEEYLIDTPDVPSYYVKYLTDTDTAITSDEESLFFNASVLTVGYDTEVYLPPTQDGKTITPHISSGKITGFFDIDGNSTADIEVFYKDIFSGDWYRRIISVVGIEVACDFAPIINAEPSTAIYVIADVYSSAGTILTTDIGNFSTTGGASWGGSTSSYVEGSTKLRVPITPTSAFGDREIFTVTVNGTSRPIEVITRIPRTPEFSESDYSVVVSEGASNSLITVYPTVIGEGDLTFSLSGPDSDLFEINTSGVISKAEGVFDFESPVDVGSDNIYNLIVTANNGFSESSVGLSVQVTDVDEIPPVINDPGNLTIEENTVGSWSITLSQGTEPVTFTKVQGKDSNLFSLSPSGLLVFTGSNDFEVPEDTNSDNIYHVDIEASNTYGTDQVTLNLEITNVIEDSIPTAVSYGTITGSSLGAVFYAEAELSGMESGATITVVNGEVTNNDGSTWGSETTYVPGSSRVRVQVTASSNYEEVVAFSSIVNGVTVSGSVVTLNTPVVMPASQNYVVDEHNSTIGSISAIAGYGAISYEITSGPDGAAVSIDSEGGLHFIIDTDWHSPSDSNSDNTYEFVVRGYNGETEDFTSITVTVMNVILPVKMPRSKYFRYVDVAQALPTILPLATDDITTYSVNGVDSGLIVIDPNTGDMSFNQEVLFENALDANGDNKYLFNVVYSNASSSSSTSVRVDIVSSTQQSTSNKNKLVASVTSATIGTPSTVSSISSRSL